MANYIHHEIVCEAYSHLDIKTYHDEESRNILEAELRSFFLPRAQFMFGNDVDIKIDFEDGSLKTKIAVLATFSALITAYPSFRDGAEQLTRDAIILAQAANLEMIFKTRAAHCDRIRIEKRAGVAGRIQALLRNIETIRDNSGHHKFPSSDSDIHEISKNINELKEWKTEAEKLIDKLNNEDSKVCVAAGLLEELEKFPEQLPWFEESRKDNFKTRLLAEEEELSSKIDGVAAKYSRLLDLYKQYFRKIILEHEPESSNA